MEKLQPVNGNVIIKIMEQKEGKTSGGIIIPETAKEKPTEGNIMAVSADSSDEISVGDRVIFKEYSGTKVTHQDEEFLVIQESEILAKIVEVDSI